MSIDYTPFIKTIWDYYAAHKRIFPWRDVDDPYKVLVSEIMLQQTQTFRVIDKYNNFINRFESFEALANAPTKEVLHAWQGLGYNRRALALQNTAKEIVSVYHAQLPRDPEVLKTLPGIGVATAGSLAAFAYNIPTIFIETNIRAVYLHHFFADRQAVKDQELLVHLQATLDHTQARQWYYALMDYGVYLKSTNKNPNTKSAHYTKQSKFEGSDRQIRGMILKLLVAHPACDISYLFGAIDRPQERIMKALKQLEDENFLLINDQTVAIK